MTNPNTESDARLDAMLASVRGRAWPGPDHSPKVDAFLQERIMRTQSKPMFNKTTIALVIAGVLGGGAVTAAVTHQVMSQRAKIIAEDGTEYDVELLPTPEGAAGTFVTDDGTVYGIDMVEKNDGSRSMTVDIDSASGGTSTVIVDDTTRPSVTVAPGEKASIHVGSVPAAGKFIDEDGVEHEIDADAIATWITEGEDD